jgi:hypothetical protein
MSTNFHLAPPSKTVDGLLSVPIDNESINAVFKIHFVQRNAKTKQIGVGVDVQLSRGGNDAKRGE